MKVHLQTVVNMLFIISNVNSFVRVFIFINLKKTTVKLKKAAVVFTCLNNVFSTFTCFRVDLFLDFDIAHHRFFDRSGLWTCFSIPIRLSFSFFVLFLGFLRWCLGYNTLF